MATVLANKAQVYWDTGADSAALAAASLIAETRNWEITMTPDYAEDTVHGDTFKTRSPTFQDFTVKITGLFSDVATVSARVVTDALAKTIGRFYLYLIAGSAAGYWYGHGRLALDTHNANYTDFSQFNFSITATDTPTLK